MGSLAKHVDFDLPLFPFKSSRARLSFKSIESSPSSLRIVANETPVYLARIVRRHFDIKMVLLLYALLALSTVVSGTAITSKLMFFETFSKTNVHSVGGRNT